MSFAFWLTTTIYIVSISVREANSNLLWDTAFNHCPDYGKPDSKELCGKEITVKNWNRLLWCQSYKTYYHVYGELIPAPATERHAGVCNTNRGRCKLKPQSACKKQVTLAAAVIPYDMKGSRWQAITDAVKYYIAEDMVPIYTAEVH